MTEKKTSKKVTFESIQDLTIDELLEKFPKGVTINKDKKIVRLADEPVKRSQQNVRVSNGHLEIMLGTRVLNDINVRNIRGHMGYYIGKVLRLSKQEFEDFTTVQKKIMQELCELDDRGEIKQRTVKKDDGSPMINPDGSERKEVVWKGETEKERIENEKAANDRINEYRKIMVEIPMKPIKIDTSDEKFPDLKPIEMDYLGPFFIDKMEIEDEKS